jgi:hypothetical protein
MQMRRQHGSGAPVVTYNQSTGQISKRTEVKLSKRVHEESSKRSKNFGVNLNAGIGYTSGREAYTRTEELNYNWAQEVRGDAQAFNQLAPHVAQLLLAPPASAPQLPQNIADKF